MSNALLSPDFSSIQSAVKQVLTTHAEFCFLLGSAATPRFHKESDIDLAVFWKASVFKNIELQTRLYSEIRESFEVDVDLISLNEIDVIYGIQVVETGRLLFSNDAGLLLQWKAEQLSKYPDFKATRKVIEDNILKRKSYV